MKKGYLYVAQPPLYRVLDRKKEFFIKDEEGFNDFILTRISENEAVLLDDGREISGNRLITMLNRLVRFFERLDRLSRKGFSSKFIEFLVLNGVTNKRQFKDRPFMENLFVKLEEGGFSVSDISLGEEDGYYEFSVTETKNGGQRFQLDWEFLSSPELRQLMELSDDFCDLKRGSFRVGGEEREKIEDPKQLLNEFMEKAKKGLGIQRYKGFG